MAQLFDIKKVTIGPRALVARVELAPSAPLMTGDDPEGTERVLGLMPGLADHACLGDASASFGEVISDTELAHLLEHVTVELLAQTNGDIKTGVAIVLRALEEPVRQIAVNAGVEGSVVVEKVKSKKSNTFGYDAAKNDYGDMIERGIADPTKVTRSALQNAASVAAMVLTTESLVSDLPEKNPPAAAPQGGGMGGMY